MSEKKIPKQISPKDVYTEHYEIWDIASNVQYFREKKKLSQKQLGELMGYKSASFVSKLELWETDKLSHERVESLAKCLDVDVNELLKGYERIPYEQSQIEKASEDFEINYWKNPIVRFFYSKPAILIMTCFFMITNLLLSLVYGMILFAVMSVLIFIFYKIFTTKRKHMILISEQLNSKNNSL